MDETIRDFGVRSKDVNHQTKVGQFKIQRPRHLTFMMRKVASKISHPDYAEVDCHRRGVRQGLLA